MESPSEKWIPDREPAFLAADEEIAAVLGDLRRRKIRPHCGSRQDRAPNFPVPNSGRLFSFIACLRRRYRRYETLGMFFPDVGLIVTDSDLRVAAIMHPAPGGSGGEQGGESAQSLLFGAIPIFKPGDALDEASYGLNAFVLAKRSGRIRAVAGAVHTCPHFEWMWTVAVPFGKEPLGYVGLFFSTYRDPYGYASWLIEVAEQIEREVRDQEEYSTSVEAPLTGQEGDGVTGSSWKVVRPSLAVRIPGSVATKLSVREKEVLELLAAGASTGEIARELHLSRSTIKTHIARIAEKLGIEPGVKSILMFIDRFAR